MQRYKDLRIIINGEPEIGEDVYIGEFSEVNAKGAKVQIGDCCDIASFVSINVADSHYRCAVDSHIAIERGDIVIGSNVFIGSHCFIGKNTYIGNNSVIAAGSILIDKVVPPFSLVLSGPTRIKEGYYAEKKHPEFKF